MSLSYMLSSTTPSSFTLPIFKTPMMKLAASFGSMPAPKSFAASRTSLTPFVSLPSLAGNIGDQMSAQETTIFDNCPSIGDDPPHFRGVKTPVTDLLDQSDRSEAARSRRHRRWQQDRVRNAASAIRRHQARQLHALPQRRPHSKDRMTIDDDSDDDSDSPPISDIVAGIGDVDMFDDPGPVAPSPAQLEAIFADVDRELRPTPGTMQVVEPSSNPEPHVSLSALQDNPFFTVLSYGSESALVRLPSGQIVSCLTRDLYRVHADYLPSPAFAPSPAIA